MATRKRGFLYPSVPIKELSPVHLHLQTYAQVRNLTLGQAINAILGDWADAMDGRPSPFGSHILLGSANLGDEQRQQQERQAQAVREREDRVASTASQWI